MENAKFGMTSDELSELSLAEIGAVSGGIGVTRPMEEGIYIDGVLVYTSAWSVYALLNSGAVSSVTVQGI